MPRIKSASADEAKANPREFAIYKQLAAAGGDDIPAQAVIEYANDKSLGDAAAATTLAGSAEAEFKDFAAAFKKVGPAVEGEGNAIGWAARDESGVLAPYKFTRRAVGPKDVSIKITHAGICHSDIHTVKGEWGPANYPLIPGHEIVGFVTEVGSEVSKYSVGDKVGVGCMVNSCRTCGACKQGEEQYCGKFTLTYNATDADGTNTQGGYSTHIVVIEDFVVRVPDSLPMAGAAPLLCAGITVYSPLRYYGLDKPGMKVGVVGMGGLGHMAVKYAKAFGCEVTVLSRSENKRAETMAMGADHFLLSTDEEAVKAAHNTLDGIIDTVSAMHEIAPLFDLLHFNGKLVLVGAPPAQLNVPHFPMIFKRITFGGSLIGGIPETQEMLDFSAKHGITCDVEVIDADYANKAYERVLAGDVKFRFVIDVQKSLLMDA